MIEVSNAERIAALEVQVENLKEVVVTANDKLDELLNLRNKGVGAFWLASALLGTGFIGAIVSILDWIRS